MSNFGLNNNDSSSQAAAMLRAAQQAGGFQTGNSNTGNFFPQQMNQPMQQQQTQQQQQQQQIQHFSTNFEQDQLQHSQQAQQQQHININSNDPTQAGLNISNEIKRLQQLHQLGAGNPTLLMNSSQQQHDPSATAFLQCMFDAQQNNKTNNPQRFDNSLGGSMGVTGVPQGTITSNTTGATNMQNITDNNNNNMMQLPSNFFADARLLMAQNHFPQTMSFPGLQPQATTQQQQQQSAEMPLPSPHSLFHRDGSRRMRGGVIEPFPEKLHRLLMEVEAAGRSDVISFVAGGRAFAIHKPDKFFKEIVPLYFRQSRLSSFKRQLNLYGFELINTGPARGGYFHELFQKEHPELCRRMRRVAVKVVSSSSDKKKDSDKKNDQDKDDDNHPNTKQESGSSHGGVPGFNI